MKCGKFIDLRKTVLKIIFWFAFKKAIKYLENKKATLSGPILFTENPFNRFMIFYEMNVHHFINYLC